MGKRLSVLGAAGIVFVASIGVAAAAGHLQTSATDAQPVSWFADGSDTGGRSYLTRTEGMLFSSIEADNLTPGNAYTVWWIVFNDPDKCSAPGCGEDDIFNEDSTLNTQGVMEAKISVGNATGNIAKSDGTAEFGAQLTRDGGNADGHQILFPAGLQGDSVLTASGNDAEVHVVVQNHGRARGGSQLLSQLSYFESGCTPLCSDVQFSVHRP